MLPCPTWCPAAHPCAEAVAAAVAQCAPIPAAARHAPISRAVGDGSWAEAGGAIVAALVHGRIEYSSTLLSGQADGRARLSEFRGAVFVGGFSYADTLDSAKVRRPLNYSTIPCDRREYARARGACWAWPGLAARVPTEDKSPRIAYGRCALCARACHVAARGGIRDGCCAGLGGKHPLQPNTRSPVRGIPPFSPLQPPSAPITP